MLSNPCLNWQYVSNDLDYWIPRADARNYESSFSIGIRNSCPTSFCRTHASFVVVVTFLYSIFFASAITNKSNFSIILKLNNHRYLSLQNNRYCNQALAMMLEIDTDSEPNSFDQEHFSLCLGWEDTVRKKEKFRHASLTVYLSWNKISCWITN